MAETLLLPGETIPQSPSATSMLLWRLRRNRKATIGLGIVVSLILVAVFAPLIAPYDPADGNLRNNLAGPSSEHWFGTDKNGRDVFSRVVFGARTALLGSLAIVLISEVIGIPLGLWSAYRGGWIDELISRGLDVFLAFPPLLLAFAVVAAFGPGIERIIVTLGILYVPFIARVVRSVTLVQKEMTYTEAARAMGYPHRRIVFRHLLPNCISSIIVISSLDLAFAMLDIAALSFLGFGVQEPTPEWGRMLANGKEVLLTSPHVAIFSGLAIMVAVLGFNLFGDGLRDVLDPRQAQK